MKYNTLAELVDAYKEEQIKGPLLIDNDTTLVFDGDEKVFKMHPEDLLEEALELLEIPSEKA